MNIQPTAIESTATQSKTLDDCHCDAIYLHGLMQGLDELMGSVEYTPSPAVNAVWALVHVATQKAEALKDDLERVEQARRPTAR